MKVLSASLLVAGLAFAGAAHAQSSGYYGDDRYQGQDEYPQGAVYDYARVLRVDPVIGSRYGNGSQASTRCTYRQADDVYVGDDGYGNGYGNGGYYDRDRYSRNGDYGRNEGYGDNGYRNDQASRTVATVIGGIAGAVLGSQVGDGSGRYVGTAVGTMVGGMAGRSIYDNAQRNRQVVRRGTVRVCDPGPVYNGDGYDDDERLDGYDVTYEYANRTYHTRTSYHPGDRLRVRVDVQPE